MWDTMTTQLLVRMTMAERATEAARERLAAQAVAARRMAEPPRKSRQVREHSQVARLEDGPGSPRDAAACGSSGSMRRAA